MIKSYDFSEISETVQSKIISNRKWAWRNNIKAKYINLRIDTRDGTCTIKDRNGDIMTLEEMLSQIGGK